MYGKIMQIYHKINNDSLYDHTLYLAIFVVQIFQTRCQRSLRVQWINQLTMVNVPLIDDFAPIILFRIFSGDVFVTAGELEARNAAESAAATSTNVGVADDGDRPLQKSTLHWSIIRHIVEYICPQL